MPSSLAGAYPLGGDGSEMKGGRRGASVKTLKRMLKKAGLKVSGKKATLTRRAKKAHLKMRGGAGGACSDPSITEEADCTSPNTWTPAAMGARRRRGSRKSRRGGKLY